jgi:predicted alpha-1,6-mannanase (GH76 family)
MFLTLLAASTPASASAPTVAAQRAAAGMRALAHWYEWGKCRAYDPSVWFRGCQAGSFEPSAGWWNAANVLTTVTDYTRLSGDPTYVALVHDAFDSRDDKDSISTNNVDDDGWWALAWIDAAELDAGDSVRRARELARAEFIFDDMDRYWDGALGGGVWWQKVPRSYKNAIANELYMAVAAKLYQDTGRAKYLSKAQAEYHWFFEKSDLYKPGHPIVDGIKDPTSPNQNLTFDPSTWTYNQGVILGALVTLSKGGPKVPESTDTLPLAKAIADTAIDKLSVNGILTENGSVTMGIPEPEVEGERKPRRVHAHHVQALATDCSGPDCPQFKGIFMRNLGTLARELPDSDRTKYEKFFQENAESIWQRDRIDAHGDPFFGTYWQGPRSEEVNAMTEASALDALVGAMSVETRALEGK